MASPKNTPPEAPITLDLTDPAYFVADVTNAKLQADRVVRWTRDARLAKPYLSIDAAAEAAKRVEENTGNETAVVVIKFQVVDMVSPYKSKK